MGTTLGNMFFEQNFVDLGHAFVHWVDWASYVLPDLAQLSS